MNKRFRVVFLALLLASVALTGCPQSSDEDCPIPSPTSEVELQSAYQNAIADALDASAWEVSHDLIAITPENTSLVRDAQDRVLMLVYTDYSGYDGREGESMIIGVNLWLTVVPEVHDRVAESTASRFDLPTRLDDVLGLPPHYKSNRLVEMWVNSSDLFRPAPDPEITDTTAGLLSDSFFLQEEWFRTWYASTYLSDYGPSTTSAFPWTRLGYTYDWGSPCNEKGVSEFVLKKGAIVQIESVQTAEEYFADDFPVQ